MAPSSRDRISVDLRGLRTALFERAAACGVSPSAFVRRALADSLGTGHEPAGQSLADAERNTPEERTRLCLRMSRAEAAATLSAARAAGLPVGAFIAGLVAGVPVIADGGRRAELVATLVASSAELSTLSRNVHHLSTLLRQGSVRAAQEYREMLDTLTDEVRGHLVAASSALADLRPAGATDRQAARTAKPRRVAAQGD